MNILLTGPTGFIGSAFARLALERGHRVGGLVIPGESISQALAGRERLSWFRGTLETAPWAEIEPFAPEVCVHTAWITTPGVYLESPENEKFRHASADFLRRVRACGTNHIVGLGTCVEYQITDQPLSEELTPLAPTTTYARCKNDLRVRLEAEAAAEGFGFCWGRVFYPYGPGEHPSRLCSSILHKLSAGESITLRTPTSTKDYIFIEDLAAALLTVVEKRFRGTINLGTGQGVSVGEIARRLGALLGRAQLVQEAVVPAADPFPFVVADAGKLKSLGWSQAVSLEDGLSRLVRSQLGSLSSF